MKLPNGHYRTAAGSTMTISGEHGGISVIDFDWFEEDEACIDCTPQAYDENGFLVWHCDICGGGGAQLYPVERARGQSEEGGGGGMSKYDKHLVASTHPVLKWMCRPIDPGEPIAALCEIMEAVCKKGTRKGVGLAAPQVGKAVRLIYVNCRDERGTIRGNFMVNPVITSRAKTTNIEEEECLSYPGKSKAIARPDWVEVEYLTRERRPRSLRAAGYRARVICHEVDHLDGICRVGDDSAPDGDADDAFEVLTA